MSAMEPGALEIIALPDKAPRNLKTISSVTDVQSPHGMMKTVNKNKLAIETGLLPYISLSGARITEPIARPMRYKVNPSVTKVSEVSNSLAISSSPAV